VIDKLIDCEKYQKIKKMSCKKMQEFLMWYADNLRSEIGQIKGIGKKCLDEIMGIIKSHIM